MSSLSLGTLNVNIIKAKSLQKIENGTKKNLTIKNPIIKIDYISGTKISTPAEKQGDEFIWNCKLNFEAIKDKTSFFMQCYNNNTEDNYNLLGETRIPLILAIENEKFKQWYPIYLKEKKRQKNTFICKGEILLDIEFLSIEKIKSNNLDFSSLLLDNSIQNSINRNSIQIPRNPSTSRSIISKSSSKLTGFSIVSSEDAQEIPRQPPKTLPRYVRNIGYRNNGISKYNNEKEKIAADCLYESMRDEEDPIYNDAYFNEKYNDSYNINSNDVEDLANQSFSYSPFMKNKQPKLPLSKSSKSLKRSNSITNAKLERNKLKHNYSLPTKKGLDKGFHYGNYSLPRKITTTKIKIPVHTLSAPAENVFNTSSLRFSMVNPSNGSDINTIITNSDVTSHSLPLSNTYNQNSNDERENLHKVRLSNSTGNYSVINSVDENNFNNILRSQSNPSEFNLYRNSVLSDNDPLSFQNSSLSPSILSTNNEIKNITISQNLSLNQNNSISLNELTSEEKDFILKMNSKYKKNMIVIDDNEIKENTQILEPITTSSSTSSIEYSQPKKRAKHIFINIFHSRNKKKSSKKDMKKNKLRTTLKREKSVVSMKDTKTGKVYTTTTTTVTTVSRSLDSSIKKKLKRKESNISRKSLKIINKSMEKNKEIINLKNEFRQPFSDITNKNDNEGRLKRKNAIRYSRRNTVPLAMINPSSNNEQNNSFDSNSNETNDSSSTINRIIEPYHHMSAPIIMENNDMKKENIDNNQTENNTNKIQYLSYIPLRNESKTNNNNNIVLDIPVNKDQNGDINSSSDNDKTKDIQINNIDNINGMVMYNEPLSLSETDHKKEIKMETEPSGSKYKTIAQIISEKNSQQNQHKEKEPEIMDIDYIQPESALNSTIQEIKKDMKTKTKSLNNESNIIDNNECSPQEILHQNDTIILDKHQNSLATSRLTEIMEEPFITSKQGMTDQEFQNYSRKMIQKLQYRQLSQRISLSFNHYHQYQDLLQQVNENKQPYDQLTKMKEQLYRQQQNQIRKQSELHSQQRDDLQHYLYYLQ
jgi:hypothetical protein